MSRSRRRLLLVRGDLRAAVRRVVVCLPMLWVRVGLRLNLRSPDTLFA